MVFDSSHDSVPVHSASGMDSFQSAGVDVDVGIHSAIEGKYCIEVFRIHWSSRTDVSH